MRQRKMLPVRVVAPTSELPANFVRGFVATGLLAALQERGNKAAAPVAAGTVLRQALRGGTALAAGCAAADAWQRRDYGAVLAAMAGGAAGLVAIDYLARRTSAHNGKKGKDLGQEKTQESAA